MTSTPAPISGHIKSLLIRQSPQAWKAAKMVKEVEEQLERESVFKRAGLSSGDRGRGGMWVWMIIQTTTERKWLQT